MRTDGDFEDRDLPQGLLAQLGSSAGAGRERSQGANLFTRHADHLLSLGGKKKGGEDRNRTYLDR